MSYTPSIRLLLILAAGTCVFMAAQAWGQSYSIDDSPVPTIPIVMNPTLTVQTTPLNPYKRYLDGQWHGVYLASDGKVYSGGSSHSDLTSGVFFQYNPATAGITMLSSDLSATSHESAPPQVPQGKLHSDIVENKGWIYFTTHLADYSATGQNNFTGSHMLGYQLGSAEAGSAVWRDFGVIQANYTSYAGISVDPIHDYLYTSVTQWWKSSSYNKGYLYRYNTDGTGKTQIASNITENFYQFVDKRGDMWFAHYNNSGTMYKVSGATGAVTTYANALPLRRNTTSDTTNTSTADRYFGWGQALDGDRFLFSMGGGDGGIWEMDTSKMLDGNPSDAFKLVRWIGSHSSGLALGGDTLYYIQSADPNWTQGAKARDHHIKSIDITNPAAITDWGRVVDQSGRTPYRSEGMAADDQGHVYFTGDWRVLQSDPLNYRSLRREFGTTGDYINLWRGLMFATVTLPEPASMTLLLAGFGLLLARRHRKKA